MELIQKDAARRATEPISIPKDELILSIGQLGRRVPSVSEHHFQLVHGVPRHLSALKRSEGSQHIHLPLPARIVFEVPAERVQESEASGRPQYPVELSQGTLLIWQRLGVPKYFSGYGEEQSRQLVLDAGLDTEIFQKETILEDTRKAQFLWVVARRLPASSGRS